MHANDVCIQCHSQGRPLQNPIQGRYYDWPVGFHVGLDLRDFWRLEEHRLGETTFTHFADGTAHKNRMQGNDFFTSEMYLHGSPASVATTFMEPPTTRTCGGPLTKCVCSATGPNRPTGRARPPSNSIRTTKPVVAAMSAWAATCRRSSQPSRMSRPRPHFSIYPSRRDRQSEDSQRLQYVSHRQVVALGCRCLERVAGRIPLEGRELSVGRGRRIL